LVLNIHLKIFLMMKYQKASISKPGIVVKPIIEHNNIRDQDKTELLTYGKMNKMETQVRVETM
jgi:hypothetical protein